MARQPHKPTAETRAQVSSLASFGVVHDDIAAFLGISDVTLRKYYAKQLKIAAINANHDVGNYLFHLASGRALKDKENPATHAECSRSAMFWAKTRMGWRETNNLDHTSSDGSMSPREIVIKAPGSD
jgi:hypothetical protein